MASLGHNELIILYQGLAYSYKYNEVQQLPIRGTVLILE